MQQHFRDSHIEQVAGGNIYNFSDHGDLEGRREELLRRGEWHIEQRDAAGRARLWNRYVPIQLMLVAGMLAFLLHILSSGFYAASIDMPIEGAFIAAIAVNMSFLGKHRERCNTLWHDHNEAIGEINRVLAVL